MRSGVSMTPSSEEPSFMMQPTTLAGVRRRSFGGRTKAPTGAASAARSRCGRSFCIGVALACLVAPVAVRAQSGIVEWGAQVVDSRFGDHPAINVAAGCEYLVA